jgi:ParB family chromosome partitioning protein
VRPRSEQPENTKQLLRTYHQETARQRLVIQKSKICETRLLFVVSALKQLFKDENFVNLLRAEGLDTLPQYLADRIRGEET